MTDHAKEIDCCLDCPHAKLLCTHPALVVTERFTPGVLLVPSKCPLWTSPGPDLRLSDKASSVPYAERIRRAREDDNT